MKKIATISLIIFSFSILFFGFGKGPANKKHDKTGSPISDGKCIDCHSAGKYGVQAELRIFDGDNEVSGYVPGKQYTIKYRVKHTGNPKKYGFQTVALSSDNKNAGKFANIQNGFNIKKINNIEYLEHSSPKDNEFMNVDWTAPTNGIGDISIYFGAIAANGNGGRSGDGGDTTAITLHELNPNYVKSIKKDEKNLFSMKSNIVSQNIEISLIPSIDDFSLFVISKEGRKILSKKGNNLSTDNLVLDISQLSTGVYYLYIRSKGNFKALPFVKI